MADLGYTQAQWTQWLGKEVGASVLAPLRLLREIEDRFYRERTQAFVILDPIAHMDTTGCTFAGADPGANCTPEGWVYVRITGAGPYTVSVYSTTGASGLVAQGTAAADATATLAAQNSSGLTGTWDLPASVTLTTADELKVQLVPDFKTVLDEIYAGGDENDTHSKSVLAELYDNVAASLRSAKGSFLSALSRIAISDGQRNEISRWAEFLEAEGESTIYSDTATESDGVVSRKRSGILLRAKNAMSDETTGGEQFVVKRAPSAGAGSFRTENSGSGAVGSHTPGDACPAMRATFQCTRGVDTGDLGEEQFDGYFSITKAGNERRITVSGLRVGKQWEGPYGFGPVTLTRTLSKTGDGSNLIFVVATSATVTGERNDNTDEGTLYWQTEANGSNWDISFFKSSSRSSASLVSKATNIAASATFTTSSQNSSGLVVDWQMGGTVSATTGTLLLNGFYVSNSSKVPDEFTVTVTVASEGRIQTIVSEEFPGGPTLNSTTSGSETVEDGYAAFGTFPPFAVEDN